MFSCQGCKLLKSVSFQTADNQAKTWRENGESGLTTKTLGLRTPCVDGSMREIIIHLANLLIQCHRACAVESRVDTTLRYYLIALF